MYTLIGIKSDGSETKPLTYPTLAEVLKRLQDLIEADEAEIAYGETEERGITMFTQYTVIPHEVARIAHPTPSSPPTPPPNEPDKPTLRLVR
jgi:hypothetical protein